MTKTAQNVLEIMNILPEEEQAFLYQMAKRLVLAWDPDYTKVTPKERADMEEAEREIERGECCTMEELCGDLGIDLSAKGGENGVEDLDL